MQKEIAKIQELLISRATGSASSEEADEYLRLRKLLLADARIAFLLPPWIKDSRTLDQFWPYIKHRFPTYADRREFIWKEFHLVEDHLDGNTGSPSDADVTMAITKFDSAHVQVAWQKALERRASDPEGAITSARTLLEAVCKHILDASGTPYDDAADMNTLYRLTAKQLKLAPNQHTEQVFKQILGGCTAVVEGLGSLRNRLSDAHGKGKAAVKPAPRHAELAVNLAGALAMYLLATWDARNDG